MLIVLLVAVLFTVVVSLLIVLSVDRRRSKYVAALAKKHRMTYVGGDDGTIGGLPFPMFADAVNGKVENLVTSKAGTFGWNYQFTQDGTTYAVTCASVECPEQRWEYLRIRPSDAAPDAFAPQRGLLNIELSGTWLLGWTEGHESETIFANMDRVKKMSIQL